MKSPQEHRVIQIELTNACARSCSNCTRFCGHHVKPFFMELEVFHRAVDSLEGYGGMIGVMGGEPTLHPRFDECARYLAAHFGPAGRLPHGRRPIRNFAEYRMDYYSDLSKKRGLWTSLGPGYYKHFEVIQEVFEYQCVNDHVNPGLHQALLATRKELGIADAEWYPLRDACWIQNLWSSCITPKGAFFCEIAGALDMLFDGPGGWPVEPGWWKRKPEEFGDQLQWCEWCGAALHTPRRRAHEEVDDLSPALLEKLRAAGSPKIRQGRYQVMDVKNYSPAACECEPTSEWYLPEEDETQRVAGTNASLFPKMIDMVVVSSGNADVLEKTLAVNIRQADRVVVAARRKDEAAVRPVAEALGAQVVVSDAAGGAGQEADLVNGALRHLDPRDWVLILDEEVALAETFKETAKGWILNPGCLYEAPRLRAPASICSRQGFGGGALFLMFHVRAGALKSGEGMFYSANEVQGTSAEEGFRSRWPADKRVNMAECFAEADGKEAERVLGRLMAAHVASLWKSLADAGARLALYGGGRHTRWMLALIRARGLVPPVAVMDDTPFRDEVDGIPLSKPEACDVNGFDAVVLSTHSAGTAEKLAARCRALWGGRKAVIRLYEFFPEAALRKTIRQI